MGQLRLSSLHAYKSVTVRLPLSLLAAVDVRAARVNISREAWIRQTLATRLEVRNTRLGQRSFRRARAVLASS